MLETLTVSQFADCLGSKFRFHFGASEPLEAELVEATALGPANSRGPDSRQAFSLEFRGPLRPILPQRIYPTEHDRLGTMELFIVPIGPDEVGMRYQVIFN